MQEYPRVPVAAGSAGRRPVRPHLCGISSPGGHLVCREGITVRRILSDNGSGYVSRVFRTTCEALRLSHRRTQAYTPRTNGKAEHLIQTLLREWAYAVPYPTSRERRQQVVDFSGPS